MTNYEKHRAEDEGISFSDVVNELHYLHILLKSDIEDVEPNWCEYLMWDRDNYSMLPVEYIYKYYNDKEVDEEMIRRLRFHKESRDRFKNK